ncbi:unnamed protein product [Caenorhabditis sp. 36 PRJEB53466]|nr:unnamed protein product [Caenorhabditis sp. 36 PRJEB53466]
MDANLELDFDQLIKFVDDKKKETFRKSMESVREVSNRNRNLLIDIESLPDVRPEDQIFSPSRFRLPFFSSRPQSLPPPVTQRQM